MPDPGPAPGEYVLDLLDVLADWETMVMTSAMVAAVLLLVSVAAGLAVGWLLKSR